MEETVQEGDTVILMDERKAKLMITVTKGHTFQNTFGAFHHQNMIGVKYGAKLWSASNRGYIHLLRPNPFLITETVAHKTQILFQMDISLILLMLDIRPGKIVVESGTGSGSLSSSIAQALSPSGHLHTYEFNEERADNGQQLMKKLGYSGFVTNYWRDVYGNGFQALAEDNDFNKDKEFPTDHSVDSIFLDLPQPWQAFDHAHKVIKQGGRLCSFSPCIEQVQKSCSLLKEKGWKNIETYECLKRHFERRVKTEQQLFGEEATKKIQTNEGEGVRVSKKEKVYYSAGVPKAYGHTGYLTFAIMP